MTGDHRDPVDLALEWLLQVQQNPEDSQLRERLADWLASDDAHLIAYRKAERVWGITGLLPPRQHPVELPSAVSRVQPARSEPHRRRRFARAVAAVAACCTLALLVQQLHPTLRADVVTATGERREVQLPDGSQLSLDAQSSVVLDFADGRREVRVLTGQAYFEVVKDSAHPFRVLTGQLSVTVTGTAFNVDSMRQRVNVTEGSVRVSGPHSAEASLLPGQGVELSADGALQSNDQPIGQVAAWRQGRLILRQERIADVIDALRPYCSDVLLLRDSEFGEKRITGVYDLDDPDNALRAILRIHGGELSRVGPILLIGGRG
ncbi:FecR domain-containing protein [Pseudomonas sp. KB-10]|uniref:FecR family protein n=1 Tax=Pseudomonas sp. KB-10 TaxID=2292264 RepID=UPI001BAF80BE|nr:FecR domain-containing protein [Pseudomonas sp. KB-10]